MSASTKTVDAYFARQTDNLSRAHELLSTPRYCLEGWLVLGCFIGALASSRFPCKKDGEAYVQFVLEYSGKRTFYEQIDLLFLFQWPRSKFRKNGAYKEMRHHSEIVAALEHIYGPEDKLSSRVRYVSPSTLLSEIRVAKIAGFDLKNCEKCLPLFSLAEQLYRYARCDAVHGAAYPFLNEVVYSDGSCEFHENHAITGKVLAETARCLVENLRSECAARGCLPDSL